MADSAGAVVFGIAVLMMIDTAGTALAAWLLLGLRPTEEPWRWSPSFLAVRLVVGVSAAVAGGWTAARLAPAHPWSHAGALAAFCLAIEFVRWRTASAGAGLVEGQAPILGEGFPRWYPFAFEALVVAGILLGPLGVA